MAACHPLPLHAASIIYKVQLQNTTIYYNVYITLIVYCLAQKRFTFSWLTAFLCAYLPNDNVSKYSEAHYGLRMHNQKRKKIQCGALWGDKNPEMCFMQTADKRLTCREDNTFKPKALSSPTFPLTFC